MSAWYIFGAFGWYPEIPGVGGVTILRPLFPKAVLNPPNGKVIMIRARNASREALSVQSMELNGKPNSKLWLTMDQLKRGAMIRFVMSHSSNQTWRAALSDAPPSLEPDPR